MFCLPPPLRATAKELFALEAIAYSVGQPVKANDEGTAEWPVGERRPERVPDAGR
jgi:hypothetical protein